MAVQRNAERFTDRGFGVYAEFKDDYQASVTVSESSAAVKRCAWVRINGGHCSDQRSPNKASSHLTIEQAKELRDGLDAWIDDAERGLVSAEG